MSYNIMIILSRKTMIALVCLLLACGFATIAFAYARTNAADAATTTCFGQAGTFGPQQGVTLGPGVFRAGGTFTTSSHCRDVNIKFTKLTGPIQLQVCFIRFKPNRCDSWKTFDQRDVGHWRLIATNILNGADYQVGIKTSKLTSYKGFIAD
ncbi:MAG: hypothetical protein J2P36_14565 [Ktedonobacteraceae bacterium]|nr:hypothetical protein [Ktedonobacteraceae bacterium]